MIRASRNSSLRPSRKNGKAQPGCSTERSHARHRMKYWELIADNLCKAGWSLGCVSAIDSNGQTIFVADAHRHDFRHTFTPVDLAILLSQRDAARCNHCFRHEDDPPRKRFTNTVLAVLGLHSCSSSRLQTSQHEIRPTH
jgi:hypothetical protein